MGLDRAMELFATKLKEDLQENLQSKLAAKSTTGHDGNSRLGASIRIEYLHSVNGEGMTTTLTGFELYLSDYYYWVNKGRAAGKGISRDGQEKLALWIKSRGLVKPITSLKKKQIKSIKNKQVKKAVRQVTIEKQVKQIVFVMSKKIKEKGFEANHFFDEVINDGRIERFTAYLKEQYAQDLQLQLIEPLKSA